MLRLSRVFSTIKVVSLPNSTFVPNYFNRNEAKHQESFHQPRAARNYHRPPNAAAADVVRGLRTERRFSLARRSGRFSANRNAGDFAKNRTQRDSRGGRAERSNDGLREFARNAVILTAMSDAGNAVILTAMSDASTRNRVRKQKCLIFKVSFRALALTAVRMTAFRPNDIFYGWIGQNPQGDLEYV